MISSKGLLRYAKIRKGVIILDYVIRNKDGVYLKIDKGKVTTCSSSHKTLFNEAKAKNILNALPKTLRKFKFYIEAIPDIKPVVIESNDTEEVSKELTDWINKFSECGKTINEAALRIDILEDKLTALDNEMVNILHTIELEHPKDMYNGWLIYTAIRKNRMKRRKIKDEILVLGNVVRQVDASVLDEKRLKKSIKGLFYRKYQYRILDID